jgi:hypothetical protein
VGLVLWELSHLYLFIIFFLVLNSIARRIFIINIISYNQSPSVSSAIPSSTKPTNQLAYN